MFSFTGRMMIFHGYRRREDLHYYHMVYMWIYIKCQDEADSGKLSISNTGAHP